MPSGKYSGKTYRWVYDSEPGYVDFCLNTKLTALADFGEYCKERRSGRQNEGASAQQPAAPAELVDRVDKAKAALKQAEKNLQSARAARNKFKPGVGGGAAERTELEEDAKIAKVAAAKWTQVAKLFEKRAVLVGEQVQQLKQRLVADALNPSQTAAVQAAQRPGVSIVHGPPGTGKTKTISSIARVLLKTGALHPEFQLDSVGCSASAPSSPATPVDPLQRGTGPIATSDLAAAAPSSAAVPDSAPVPPLPPGYNAFPHRVILTAAANKAVFNMIERVVADLRKEHMLLEAGRAGAGTTDSASAEAASSSRTAPVQHTKTPSTALAPMPTMTPAEQEVFGTPAADDHVLFYGVDDKVPDHLRRYFIHSRFGEVFSNFHVDRSEVQRLCREAPEWTRATARKLWDLLKRGRDGWAEFEKYREDEKFLRGAKGGRGGKAVGGRGKGEQDRGKEGTLGAFLGLGSGTDLAEELQLELLRRARFVGSTLACLGRGEFLGTLFPSDAYSDGPSQKEKALRALFAKEIWRRRFLAQPAVARELAGALFPVGAGGDKKDEPRAQQLADFFCSQIAARGGVMTSIILDEGGQATEAETLNAVALNPARLILVGDHRQLSATVVHSEANRKAKYARSLLERLAHDDMASPPPTGAAASSSSAAHPKQLRPAVPATLLDTQYRMHPAIAKFPNAQFYEERLKNGGNTEVAML